jgi:hypothetical protein
MAWHPEQAHQVGLPHHPIAGVHVGSREGGNSSIHASAQPGARLAGDRASFVLVVALGADPD